MIVDGHNSTKWAVYMLVVGSAMLAAGYGYIDKHHSTEYWLGIAGALVLLVLFFGRSYRISKRGLTAQQKKNALKTARSARLGWLWLTVGIVLYGIGRYALGWFNEPAPFLIGGFSALLVGMGVGMLLDNFWLHAIFAWNNKDPRVRRAFGGK